MDEFRWPALVTLGTLLLLFALTANTGVHRVRHKVMAPDTTGAPSFMRAYRAHLNTVECAVLFLPALWLFALTVSAAWAGVLGAVWLAARVWYAVAYMQDPPARGKPFGLGMAVFAVLFLGAAWRLVFAS